MYPIRFSETVSILLFLIASLVNSIEYFIYMPNTIIPQSTSIIPLYISHPPAIIHFTFLKNPKQIQSFILTKTLVEIPLQISHEGNSLNKLDTEIKLFKCKELEKCFQNQTTKLLFEKTYRIPISKHSHMIELFTSKSCYRPTETLKISLFVVKIDEILTKDLSDNCRIEWKNDRFVSVNRIAERNTTFSTILFLDLYDANKKIVRTWRVDLTNKSLILEQPLPGNSSLGLWRIDYYFPGKKQYGFQEFKVVSNGKKEFLRNSKMNISIKYYDDITVSTKNIQFFVCAQYSMIRSVKGKVFGSVCLKSNEEEWLSRKPCIMFISKFNGSNKCVLIDSKTDQLNLKNLSFGQQRNRLIITVTIVDDYSRKRHFFSFMGPVLEISKYKITFLSAPYFKSMLPYYGKIQTVKYNGQPFVNASVIIQCNTVNFPHNWGHQSTHNSDNEGFIYFILSSPPSQLSVITCDIEDLSSSEESQESIKYYRPSITQTLEKWKSKSTTDLQLKLLSRRNSKDNTEELKLEIQSNQNLFDDLVMFLIANGQIIKTSYIFNSKLRKPQCQDRNDELGHYTCNKTLNKVKCMKDWEGTNCLIPRCKGSCNNGICVKIDFCFCKYGWTGQFCDKCIPSKNCINGQCSEGNDCVCRSGWTGSNCDIEESEPTNKRYLKRKKVKKSVPFKNIVSNEIVTIFTSNITWTIPLMVTHLSILVHSISKNPSSTKLFLDPNHLIFEYPETNNLRNYSSDSIKCINIHPDRLKNILIENIITLDSSNDLLQNSLYNSIISDQCTIPFQNILNFPQTLINSQMMVDFQPVEHYDFLNMIQSLNLFPISTMKLVARTCPMWKILAAYNKTQSFALDEFKITTNKPKPPKSTSKFKFCESHRGYQNVFYDLEQMQPSNEPYLIASLCSNVSYSKLNSVFIKNQNVKLKPPFYVTIGTIDSIKVHEIHDQKVTIFNNINRSFEIEISTESSTECLTSLSFDKAVVFVKPFESVSVTQSIQFNCSGIFPLLLSFKVDREGNIFPNSSRIDNQDSIVKTEQIVYKVFSGIKKFKTLNFQVCHNEMRNSSVNLDLTEHFPLNNFIKFNMKIQNSLEVVFNFFRYLYKNQNLDRILSLTMKIYEINLNKLLKNKKYFNQSLINIKKMIQAESKSLRNISRLLSPEYEILLINLCLDIPHHLYNFRKHFCQLIKTKLKITKFNPQNFTFSNFKEEEVMLMISFLLSEKMNLYLNIVEEKTTFINSCVKHLDSFNNDGLYSSILKKLHSNLFPFENLDKKGILSIKFSHLAFSYLILKQQSKPQPVLTNITKIILEKINETPINISTIESVLLLKILTDFELSFQRNFLFDKNLQNKVSPTSVPWSQSRTFEIILPQNYICSNIKIKSSYYTEFSEIQMIDVGIKLDVVLERCPSGNILLLFKNNLMLYNSIIITLPTGWLFDHSNFIEVSRRVSKCNINLFSKDQYFTIKLDLFLLSKVCGIRNISLNISQYQLITNVQVGYITTSLRNGKFSQKSFKIGDCFTKRVDDSFDQRKIQPKMLYNSLLEVFCESNQINITLNKAKLKINNNSIIFMRKEDQRKIETISTLNWENKKFDVAINGTTRWFFQTYFHMCYNAQIIQNILSYYLKEKTNLYCTTMESKVFLQGTIFRKICNDSIYPYFIKSVDQNKKLFTLQSFPDKCNLNKMSEDFFQVNLVFQNPLKNKCEKLSMLSKPNKTSFILMSPRNLHHTPDPLTLSFNNPFLIIEFVDLIL